MNTRVALIAAQFTFSFLIGAFFFGCATFKVPAPKDPVKLLPEHTAESSIINVPIGISMTGLSDKLHQLLSRNKTLNKLNREQNITGKIQDFLDGKTTALDADLPNNMYLRIATGRAWEALQNPIRLNYDLSLLLNPEAVRISSPVRKGDSAKIVVGLVVRPKLISGDIPKMNPQTLPNFAMTQEVLENGFHISLDNELSFEYISKELTKKLKGNTYHYDNKNIVIDRIKVYGSGDLAVIEVRVSGTAKGTVYLTGVPAYDESTMILSVANLDYTVETKNILAKTADWLQHTGLRDNLADRATWFIGDRIAAMKDRLSDALNRKLNRHVTLSGKIERVRLAAVGMTNTSLKAVLIADGHVEVIVF